MEEEINVFAKGVHNKFECTANVSSLTIEKVQSCYRLFDDDALRCDYQFYEYAL